MRHHHPCACEPLCEQCGYGKAAHTGRRLRCPHSRPVRAYVPGALPETTDHERYPASMLSPAETDAVCRECGGVR